MESHHHLPSMNLPTVEKPQTSQDANTIQVESVC